MRRFLPFFLLVTFLAGCLWAEENIPPVRTALRQLVSRADSGDAKALYNLATLHDTGYDSIPVDSARSTALYRLSAEKGYAPARNFLGFRYYNGDFVKKDIDSALYWIRLAADDGDITAASNLGYLLSQSEDIPHDYKEAIKWIEKAANASFPSAISQLADMKRLGLGCVADTLQAVELYEKASDAGIGDAQLKLLAMMGYKWKELPGDSALNLGLKYYTGNLPIAGVDLLETAAMYEIPQANALLGDAYSRGIGVPYDHRKSLDYFFKGALGGNPSAQYIIAELLDFFPDDIPSDSIFGLENLNDVGNAQFWYEKAREQGIENADAAYERLFSLPKNEESRGNH